MTEYVMIDRALIEREFPLLSEEGIDENKHHCEWAILQDRKRLHALLAAAPQQAAEPVGYLFEKVGCRAPDDCEEYREFVEAESVDPKELAEYQKHGRVEPLYRHPPAQPELPAPIEAELRATILALCDTLENRDDIPLHKWALKSAMLVSKVRTGLTLPASQGDNNDHD